MPGPSPMPAELQAMLGHPDKGGGAKSVAETKAKVAAAAKLSPVGAPFDDMTEVAMAKWYSLSETWKVLLRETDREALRMLCETWVELMEAQTMMLIVGQVVPSKDGTSLTESSWSRKVGKLRPLVHKMLVEFGATPSARNRVDISDPGPVKPSSKFDGLVN